MIFYSGCHHNRQKSSSSTSDKSSQTESTKIKIEKGKTIRGNIVYTSLMISKEALRKHRQVSDQSSQIKVVLLLSENIMSAEKTPLPENLTLKDTI